MKKLLFLLLLPVWTFAQSDIVSLNGKQYKLKEYKPHKQRNIEIGIGVGGSTNSVAKSLNALVPSSDKKRIISPSFLLFIQTNKNKYQFGVGINPTAMKYNIVINYLDVNGKFLYSTVEKANIGVPAIPVYAYVNYKAISNCLNLFVGAKVGVVFPVINFKNKGEAYGNSKPCALAGLQCRATYSIGKKTKAFADLEVNDCLFDKTNYIAGGGIIYYPLIIGVIF